jgi:membrane protease subunit HflK
MSWDWEKLKQQQKRKDIPGQFEEYLKKLQNLKLPGGPVIIIVIILVLVASTMIYTVGIDEVGVVQRFGEYVRTTTPGLNIKMPVGIEKVTKVKVTRISKEGFGFQNLLGDNLVPSGGSERESVSLMLTGDLNVALVPWIVHYKIRDPYKYLFKVKDVKRLLRDMSEATMRLVVGDRSINEVITKREDIANEAKQLLQTELDQVNSGLLVVTIEMKRTNVPGPVQPSFNEVNQAIQEKETLIYQANEEYNKAIPAARGEAERTIKGAEGYALERVNRAEGDAARFVALFEEYKKAKKVTRMRLFLESMKNLYPRLGEKYIIDSNQNNLLPFLNLKNQSLENTLETEPGGKQK